MRRPSIVNLSSDRSPGSSGLRFRCIYEESPAPAGWHKIRRQRRRGLLEFQLARNLNDNKDDANQPQPLCRAQFSSGEKLQPIQCETHLSNIVSEAPWHPSKREPARISSSFYSSGSDSDSARARFQLLKHLLEPAGSRPTQYHAERLQSSTQTSIPGNQAHLWSGIGLQILELVTTFHLSVP
jgi:hypothetical protein